jgi:hypothetical protein
VGRDSPPGGRQNVYCKGGRNWPVRFTAQERHDCVTTVIITIGPAADCIQQ